MKKTLFTSTSKFIITFLLLTLSVISCTKKSNEIKLAPSTDEIASSKPGSVSEVFLKMTINDATGNYITSDGGGDYINGSQSVSAKFDQWGNFIFGCGKGGHGNNTYLIRWMNFNLSSPIQVFIPPPINNGTGKGTGITTGSVAAFTQIPLQNLTVGQSECIGFTTGNTDSAWVASFHRGADDISSSPSSYVVFTRISSTQWTVTPAGSCSPNSNVCALRYGAGTLYGYYNLPFSFTLTKL